MNGLGRETEAMLAHMQRLARYNRWANRRLYDAAATLSEGSLRAERQAAFFTSVLGTLNHILVGDRLWLGRIEGLDADISGLDQVLYDDFQDLRAARDLEDARLVALSKELTPEALSHDVAYRTTGGEDCSTRLDLILAHLFNHQTHHRGQLHALVKEAGAEPPPLDLIYFLRES